MIISSINRKKYIPEFNSTFARKMLAHGSPSHFSEDTFQVSRVF